MIFSLIPVALALIVSALACRLTISWAQRWEFGGDRVDGVQKVHTSWIPRLGGVPVFAGLFSALLLAAYATNRFETETAFLIICTLPAFALGLIEDTTHRAGVLARLIGTMFAAALGYWLLQAQLTRVDVPPLDALLGQYSWMVFGLTLLAAGGIAHAINIIDGCNGLASFVSIAALTAIGIVSVIVGDDFCARVAFVTAGAMLGFFLWNFPFGRIFLGDSGAYLAGFIIAELSILLVVRNPEVSAWFPLLLVVHPVWETLFSIYRRAVVSRTRIGFPDAMHLHQLMYRRVMRPRFATCDSAATYRNAASSMATWPFSFLGAIAAVAFWNQTSVLLLAVMAIVLGYVTTYRRIVQFRIPRWLLWPVATCLGPAPVARVETAKR